MATTTAALSEHGRPAGEPSAGGLEPLHDGLAVVLQACHGLLAVLGRHWPPADCRGRPGQLYAGSVTPTASSTASTTSSHAVFDDIVRSDSSLRRFLHGLPGVDQVGCEARAAGLATRSIKTTSKAYAIDLAIRMVDLTTLEGQDTHGKVRALASKAMRPDPADPTCPATAAVCVYPDMVATAKQTLGDSGVNVAAVATAFPSGRAAMDIKLADTRDAVEAGADEIDMVIDRGAFLSGRYLEVFEEIAQVRRRVPADGTRTSR